MSSSIAITIGRLARDPELKTLPTGTTVCEFSVAWNTGYGDKEQSNFMDCVAWGKTGEFINSYFNKGKPIYLEGEIIQDRWEDRETGAKRSKHKMNVRQAKFLDQDKGAQESEGSQAADPFANSSDEDTPF